MVELPRKIVVAGASHAAVYEVMLKQLVMNTGARVELVSVGGCGLFTMVYPEAPHCTELRRSVQQHVSQHLSAGDIVFLPALRVPRLADQFTRFGEASAASQVLSAETGGLRAQQEGELAAFLQLAASRGVIVVVEAPPPVFPAPAFRCVDWFNRGNPICDGGLTVPRQTIEALRMPIVDALQRLQMTADNLYVWDPLSVLCPGEICAPIQDDRIMYFDGDHLSGFGSMSLAPSFGAFLVGLPDVPSQKAEGRRGR
ncbi:MAG: SGNH hydrolase domain-containing protein [Rhodopila sp.]